MAAPTQNDISATALLAKLEEEVAAKLQAIAGIRAALNLPAWSGTAAGAAGSVEAVRDTNSSGTIRPDEFFRMSVPDAIRRYLEIAKSPQAPKAISDALKSGGLLTTAKNFYANITTALARMETAGILTNTPGGWALAEWYAGRAKPTAEPQKKGKKTAKKKRAAVAKKPAAARQATAKEPPVKTAAAAGAKIDYRSFVSARMKEGKTLPEAAAAWQQHKLTLQ